MKNKTLYLVTLNDLYVERYFKSSDVSIMLGEDVESARLFKNLKEAIRVAQMLSGEVLIYSEEEK